MKNTQNSGTVRAKHFTGTHLRAGTEPMHSSQPAAGDGRSMLQVLRRLLGPVRLLLQCGVPLTNPSFANAAARAPPTMAPPGLASTSDVQVKTPSVVVVDRNASAIERSVAQNFLVLANGLHQSEFNSSGLVSADIHPSCARGLAADSFEGSFVVTWIAVRSKQASTRRRPLRSASPLELARNLFSMNECALVRCSRNFTFLCSVHYSYEYTYPVVSD